MPLNVFEQKLVADWAEESSPLLMVPCPPVVDGGVAVKTPVIGMGLVPLGEISENA